MREAVRLDLPGDPGAVAILSLEDAKAHLRLLDDHEDTYIEGLIADAVAQVEAWTGFAVMPQLWEITLDGFPAQIVLPIGPVTAISEIAYVDAGGSDQLVDPTAFRADLSSVEARLVPREGWPSTASWINAVTIRWAAGKGCPPGLLRAVKVLVEHMYRVRDADESSQLVWIDACRIMAPYRRFKG